MGKKTVSSKEVISKLMSFVEEDKFTDATKMLKLVVDGKIKNKLEVTKCKIYPELKSSKETK